MGWFKIKARTNLGPQNYMYLSTPGGRVELMVMHGRVKNNYEHNVVVMNLPLCPQTADDVNVIVW